MISHMDSVGWLPPIRQEEEDGFSEAWPEEPTRGEDYEPAHAEGYWQGCREGRMQFGLSKLPGLARALREGADPRTVADLLDRAFEEAMGHRADDGRPVK